MVYHRVCVPFACPLYVCSKNTNGHTKGPPGPHLATTFAIAAYASTQGATQTPFKNFVEQFCTPITHDANSTQCQRQLTIEQTKTDGRNVKAIVEELSKRELAFTRDKMSLAIQVLRSSCRVSSNSSVHRRLA